MTLSGSTPRITKSIKDERLFLPVKLTRLIGALREERLGSRRLGSRLALRLLAATAAFLLQSGSDFLSPIQGRKSGTLGLFFFFLLLAGWVVSEDGRGLGGGGWVGLGSFPLPGGLYTAWSARFFRPPPLPPPPPPQHQLSGRRAKSGIRGARTLGVPLRVRLGAGGGPGVGGGGGGRSAGLGLATGRDVYGLLRPLPLPPFLFTH